MAAEPAGLTGRLAGALLPEGRPGRPVLLACTDQALAGAGLDAAALADAARAAGGLAGAARAAGAFARAPRPRPAPPHLVALCLLVLAASRMGGDEASAADYYRQLQAIWGPGDRAGHPPYEGMAELCADGFAVLATWLADDEQGRRGLLHLPDVWTAHRALWAEARRQRSRSLQRPQAGGCGRGARRRQQRSRFVAGNRGH